LKESNKKGQLTLFVIIALVIVVAVILFFVFSEGARGYFKKTFFTGVFVPDSVQEVDNYITDCLEKVVSRVIIVNGLQGGYYNTPNSAVYYNSYQDLLDRYVPLYIDKGENILTKEELERQISIGVEEQMTKCINFSIFDTEIEYDFSDLKASSIISEGQVAVSLNFPVSIDVKDTKSSIENFEATEKTNYLLLYNLSKEITYRQLDEGRFICLTCIKRMANEQGVDVYIQESDDNVNNIHVMIYYLSKNDIDSDNLETFSFAHKFYMEDFEEYA